MSTCGVIVMNRHFRRMNNRMGIIYTLSENGTARLIFEEDRSSFEGMLETIGGETIAVYGRLVPGSAIPSTSAGPILMDVYLVDNEAGSSFQVQNVMVNLEGNHIAINNPAVTFTTKERLVGMKADVEIRQNLKPSAVKNATELFVGPMRIQLLASHKPQETSRRVSVSEKIDIPILEQSDDFLA